MTIVTASLAGIVFWFGIVLGHGFACAQAARTKGESTHAGSPDPEHALHH